MTLRRSATSEVFADLKDAKHARLLSDLQLAQDFDIQILALNTDNETAQSAPVALSQCRNPRAIHRLFAIIYGPVTAYEAVGKYIESFELNLQDPILCDRNVEYHNPHRLRREGQQVLYTYSISVLQTRATVIEAEARSGDLFALLEDQRIYAETDPPEAVSTNLYR
jgi:hypothetical protein